MREVLEFAHNEVKANVGYPPKLGTGTCNIRLIVSHVPLCKPIPVAYAMFEIKRQLIMKYKLFVTFLLLITGFAAFSQQTPNTAVSEKGLIKIAVMYPYGEGKTFNMDYYETKHMPMVAGFLGSSLMLID